LTALAKDIHLSQGSMVEVAIVEGSIVVKPKGRPKLSLARMLHGITKENQHSEVNWGGASGMELL